MKKITLTILSTLVMLLLISCESDIDKVVMSGDPNEPVASEVSFTGEFTMSNADGVLTFSWTEADFGFQSSTTYALQISPNSDFSDDVVTLLTTQLLSGTATVADLNAMLLSLDGAIGENFTMFYRVAASITSDLVVYSDINSKVFVPFETVINYPMVYVPGDYQGWAPGGDDYTRLYSYNFNSTYSSIIRLINSDGTQANFKVTSDPDWDHTNYGMATLIQDGNNYSGTCSTDGGAGNFAVDNGVYNVTIDVNALTIELTKTDDWGIIGSAVPPYDWSADIDMQYNGQRQMWEIIGDFNAGQFKFRANDDWVTNYGDVDGDGTLDTANDNNINLAEAGNYTIRFDPVALTYTVTKN